jgi:DNA-directed RNA polymerase subunit omega
MAGRTIGGSPANAAVAEPGYSPLTGEGAGCVLNGFQRSHPHDMRDDYIKDALKTIPDPNILINVISRRVKQLKRGNRPLVESLEKLSPEDTALREVIEGKISHELA